MNDNNFIGNAKRAVDFLGNEWNYECMGCSISNGEIKIPGGIIYEGKHTILGADPEIPIPGFLIVNLKRHVNSFSELNREERNEIGDVIAYAETALKELNIVKEITLVQEERSKHLHIWIFPNYSWMTEKFGKGITYLREISEYSKKNVCEDTIKEVLNVISKTRKYFEEHNIKEERRKKMKKEIVFSDYDGTIYITESDMPRNIKLIEEYRSLGGKFVIVTGRSITSARNVIKKYNLPYDYIISNNGAVIYNATGSKIYEQAINVDTSTRIINYLKEKQNIEIFYYDEQDKVEYKNQELLKIRVRTNDAKIARYIESEINTLFGNDVIAHAAFPTMYYNDISDSIVDIVSQKAGKEKTIKELLQILNMQRNQAITIGDGRNDIAMIKEYNGYSMETAEEDVKIVASRIFKSVADALEYLK